MILIQMTTSTILVTVINNIAVADTIDIIIASVRRENQICINTHSCAVH